MAGSGAAVVLSVVGVLAFTPGGAPGTTAGHPLAARPTAVPLPSTPSLVAPPMPVPGSVDDGGRAGLPGLIADGPQPDPEVEPQQAGNGEPGQVPVRTVRPGRGSQPVTKEQPALTHTPDLPPRPGAPTHVEAAKPAAVPAAPVKPAAVKPAAVKPTAVKPAQVPPAAPRTAAPGFPYGPRPYGAYSSGPVYGGPRRWR
jgi:translation initiation factor IF-3